MHHDLGRHPIGPVDTLWLRMDRPNNLMVVESVMWFDEPVDWERLLAVYRRRVTEQFPVFRRRPVTPLMPMTQSYWEDDPDYDFDRHVVRATLPAPGGEAELQAYAAAQASVPISHERPMWELHLIDGYASGSAIVTRMHHAIADGIALAHLLLSLTDEAPEDDLRDLDHDVHEVPDARGRTGLLGSAVHLGQAAGHAAGATVRGGLHLMSHLPAMADPSHVTEAMRQAAETVKILDKQFLGEHPAGPLSGTPGVPKQLVWSQALPLDGIKQVARLSDATVNDVLVAALSAGIYEYHRAFDADPRDLMTMVPVNLRDPAKPLPRHLGNYFALVMLELPSGHAAPLDRLAESKRRMDHIKHTPEAMIALGLITGLGLTAAEVERRMVDFFGGKAIGVTTNVPGPRQVRYIAGTPLAGVLGWAPCSGDQTLVSAIFSYDGTVRVGFKTDKTVIAKPALLVEAFEAEVAELVRIARAA